MVVVVGVVEDCFRDVKVERRGVRPPALGARQSSIREAPEAHAVWAERRLKEAISRCGILRADSMEGWIGE